jgi:chemotaxis protein CheD
MTRNDTGIDIFIQPGEYWFDGAGTRIRTLLGSCVAITLWNPQRRVGAMCHIMLPQRGSAAATSGADGRYADEAVTLMLRDIKRAGCRPSEFEAKLFGGGSMMNATGNGTLLPERNIETARQLIHQMRWPLVAEHTGGRGHRQLCFEIDTGDVWVRFTPTSAETDY